MIAIRDLAKSYGSTRAVDGLTFDVLPGRVTGFLGPNGAGKSTTMRMIVGLDEPTSGTVTISGRRYRDLRRPLFHVGAVLEARGVLGGRSGYHHLLCLAQSNGIPRRRVHEVLEMVGLETAARRRAKGYSLGMAQRLGLAAALLGDPPVLLCDEPINGLDPEGILWVRTLLRRLAAEGRTVLVSSHLMNEMAVTADHLVVIGQGRLIADAPTAQIVAASSRSCVVVRTPQRDALTQALETAGGTVLAGDDDALRITGLDRAAVGEIAAACGVTLHELSSENASLEAAFMELTREHVDFRALEAAS